MAEYEALERELKGLYANYMERFRNLAYLEEERRLRAQDQKRHLVWITIATNRFREPAMGRPTCFLNIAKTTLIFRIISICNVFNKTP
jgi:hypothetical protein